MSETTPASLRQSLLDRYDDLKARLAKRLGSSDLAGDAMHEAWLRLGRIESVGTVRSATSYLFQVALNAARDTQRGERRHLTAAEIDGLLHLPDDKPGPEHAAEARSDLRRLEAALAELPPRRRAILLAARLDDMPRQEIARRLGISLRLVSKELRLAHEHCLARCGGEDRP